MIHNIQRFTSNQNRTRLVLGNWKMHGRLADNTCWLNQLRALVETSPKSLNACELGICVPFPYLQQVACALEGSLVSWGAQNLSAYSEGAHTGEVSGAMLSDFKCRWVLVGHSERRTLCKEDAVEVTHKVQAALREGLTPVVCIGENLVDRKNDHIHRVIIHQLEPILALGKEVLSRIVIAYEPIWAIGTGQTATPQQAQEVHEMIRDALRTNQAEHIKILYGGSVKSSNAAALFAMPDIDGALVGSGSLVVEEFWHIATV